MTVGSLATGLKAEPERTARVDPVKARLSELKSDQLASSACGQMMSPPNTAIETICECFAVQKASRASADTGCADSLEFAACQNLVCRVFDRVKTIYEVPADVVHDINPERTPVVLQIVRSEQARCAGPTVVKPSVTDKTWWHAFSARGLIASPRHSDK